MSDQPVKRKRRWPIWVFVILALVVVIVFAAYTFAKRTAAHDIAQQLNALDIGPHEIGSISVGVNGVVANDIEFYQAGESTDQPWLTVDRLTVEHSIIELAQGTNSYNAIELAGVTATLESSSLFAGDADTSLDLSQLELPAKQLRLKDAQIVITDENKPDLAITGIQLQLDQNENDSPSAINIHGEIGDLLGSKVNVAGDLAADRSRLNLRLLANEFDVATEQWQNLPGLPQGIDKNLTVDGKLVLIGCELTIQNDDLTVAGSAEVGGLEIGLPKFGLPVSIDQGTIGFDTRQIELADFVATVDGSGEVRGKAVTSFAEFPIQTTFDTQLQNVSAASLRKIVAAIPDILAAEASGTAIGSVLVDSSTRTTINLTADAAGVDGSYGLIKAKTLSTNVVIENLVFDAQQNFASIEGVIGATAQADQQSIPDVLKTFELDSFQQQMQIVGSGSGRLNLRLPLATAEDMRTWTMKIDGSVPAGSVSGKKFVDADATIEMTDGILQFKPVSVLAVADNNAPLEMAAAANSNLQLNVRWPMVSETVQGDQATVVVSGADVPATWLMGFLQNQINNAATDPAQPNAPTQSSFVARVNQLSGTAAFETTITLPTATPDDIYSWQVDGTVRDLKVNVGDDRLQDLAGSIRMNDGQLEVQNISGNFYNQSIRNGSVGGAASVNLKQLPQASADLNLKQLPLPWLVSVAQEVLPQFAEQLQQPPIDSLAGQIDADVKYRSSAVGGPAQSLEVAVSSAQMSVSGQELRNFKLNGSFDGKQIKVVELTSRIGETGQSGKLEAQGNWSFETNQAAGKLEWDGLPIGTLAAISKDWPSSISGNSNGKLTVSTADVNQADGMGLRVVGAVGLKDLQVQQFKARDLGFDVVTKAGDLVFQNFRNADGKLAIDLGGKLALTAPYRFEASGKIAQLQLTQLLSNFTSVGDQIETASLTGLLRGDFGVAGQIENFDWKTNGEIDCVAPTYNGISLEDVNANWDIQANQLDKSKLTIEAFDGSVDLVEFASFPEAFHVKIKDIDAAQLTTVMELPTKLTGRIDGDLLLKSWSQPKVRSADLNVTGRTIGVGAADFGDLELAANYQDETLKYDLTGSVFSGKLTGEGTTSLQQAELSTLKLPLKLSLTNASVNSLKAAAKSSALRSLSGRLSAQADLQLGIDGTITADGRLGVGQAKWNRQLITRQASVHFKVTDDLLFLDDLDIDLKRGAIAGRATIPLAGGSSGRYEVSVRNLDLERLSELFTDEVQAHGLLDARLNGQIGRQITGRGFVGVHKATVNGFAGQSLRLPIQFQVATKSGSGKLELRRSTFRIFDGRATGKAEISFGSTLNIDVDMNFSNVDTEKMLAEIAGVRQADQGKLSGRLKLSGHGIRSARNLKGSFRGSLQRVSAFELPILSDAARLLSVTNLQTADFDSDAIELLLSNNQVNVKQLNFSSTLVKIAITGQAFLDGRLNLSAATRVETLQQPTLIDELAGSPLARLGVSPVASLARLSEFLNERIVFLKIGGNVRQPQIRVDTSQQLPAEVIRYFLPGSNILPTLNSLNN